MEYSSRELSAEALSALVDASAAINASLGVDATLQSIARAAAAVLKAEAASVIVLDAQRRKQVFAAAVGDRAEQLLGVEYEQGTGISGKAMKLRQAAIINDVAREKSHYKGIDDKLGFQTRSVLVAPLVHENKALGVVEVLNPLHESHFAENDRCLAMVFANLAAIAVANAQRVERLGRENRGLKESSRSGELIGASPQMRKVRDLIADVAPTSATVLLLGATGTGKELAARQLHAQSHRSGGPFIAINCAALPETLLESELFGHEAGAFTGASERRMGRFELAGGGTIFLDEIGEVPLSIQVKLLRVLEEREMFRLGGTRAIGCDVRVIAATNRDLQAEIAEGRFRQDLFYRLNVFPIELPPLRLRTGDIPLLGRHLLGQLSVELKLPLPDISPDAMAALEAYDFPGNVRELRNILERACLLACSTREGESPEPTIHPGHLPSNLKAAAPVAADGTMPQAAAGNSVLADHEKTMVLAALRDHNWNQTRAAAALGISRDNLRYRIKKYGLKR